MENSVPQKRCTGECKELKPLTEFYQRSDNGGPTARCISCTCKLRRDEYHLKGRPTKYKPKPKAKPKEPRSRSTSRFMQCSQCGEKRNLRSYSDGFDESSPVCKFCIRRNKVPRALRGVAKQYMREKTLRSVYKMSLEDYDAMFLAQFGVCAICGQATKSGKYLHVDHDHKTKVIRGLLCLHCNHLLGNAKDDIRILKNAVKYLQKKR